jgi:L-threonylcarbamoyladenylate synthase
MEPLSAEVERAVEALRAGQPVILPTDTVYGLAAHASSEEAVQGAYALKGRAPVQPSALLAADVDVLLESLPELRRRLGPVLSELLPGPYTLVVPNPARRFPWLAGANPEAIGVRVPNLPRQAATVVSRIGTVMATSANLPGGRDPATLEAVPRELLDGCGAALDAGELPGVPSTVLDLTGEPRVLREGAVPAAEALARASGAAARLRG